MNETSACSRVSQHPANSKGWFCPKADIDADTFEYTSAGRAKHSKILGAETHGTSVLSHSPPRAGTSRDGQEGEEGTSGGGSLT